MQQCPNLFPKNRHAIAIILPVHMPGMPSEVARRRESVLAHGTLEAPPRLVRRLHVLPEFVVTLERTTAPMLGALKLLRSVLCLGMAQEVALIAELLPANNAEEVGEIDDRLERAMYHGRCRIQSSTAGPVSGLQGGSGA